MNLVELFYELDKEDYINVIKSRFPKTMNEEIKIVNAKLSSNNVYIDVAFYFENTEAPRDVFYTHLYSTDIDKYRNIEKK